MCALEKKNVMIETLVMSILTSPLSLTAVTVCKRINVWIS